MIGDMTLRLKRQLFLGSTTLLFSLAFMFLGTPVQAASSFLPSNLISDFEFTNVDSMSVDEVQYFLVQQGSFLAGYSENGRLAAQIIVDAAHGFGDGSGTINGISLSPATGTVSPTVILTTLQKEQGLITMTAQNDAALRTAMGYGCPDSGGCNPNYAGLTKQVENGAWQLRYNYERAQGHGFVDYQVGQPACFSNPSGGTDCVVYENRATASLYRYTPHVYNGNFNFWNLYAPWFNQLKMTTQSLTIDSHGGILGTESHADISVHYQSNSSHEAYVAIIARRKDSQGFYSENYDLGSTGPMIVDGDGDVNWKAHRYLPYGDYAVYGAYYFNGQWKPLSDVVKYFSIRSAVISTSFNQLNDFFSSGQAASISVTYTNNEPQRVYYSGFGLAARNADNLGYDFPAVANSYLEPGQSRTITFSRVLPDGDYTIFPIYKIDSPDWQPNSPLARISVWPDDVYKLEFSSLSVVQNPPFYNDLFDANFIISNPTTKNITIPKLRMAARRFGEGNYDFSLVENLQVPAGASIPLHFQTVLGRSGQFTIWPIYLSGNGHDWPNIKPAPGTSSYAAIAVY